MAKLFKILLVAFWAILIAVFVLSVKIMSEVRSSGYGAQTPGGAPSPTSTRP